MSEDKSKTSIKLSESVQFLNGAEGVDFRRTIFGATKLRGLFKGCDFTYADLAFVDAKDAQFEDCLFSFCDFTYADFSRTEFLECVFSYSTARGADFEYSSFTNTDLRMNIFRDCDFGGMDMVHSANKSLFQDCRR